MNICLNCGSEFAKRMVIDGKTRNMSHRKYCLSCSPFGMRNTKQLHVLPEMADTKVCPRCSSNLPISEFYIRRTRPGRTTYCKACSNMQTSERARRFKEMAVEKKGGRCEICGYDRCIQALAFHHRDPSKKERRWKLSGTCGFEGRMAEIEAMCHLLCHNCHNETHAGLHPDFIVASPEGLEPPT